MQNLSVIEVFNALAWQSDMGVEWCTEAVPQILRAELPINPSVQPEYREVNTRSHASGLLESSTPSLSPRAPTGANTGSSYVAQAVEQASRLAEAAADLAQLEQAVRSFDGCPLKKSATNTVFAQGIAESRLMFIGEAPGAEEDRAGIPFCGPSGQLLDRMLRFIGLARDRNFYITNTLFWRPPGNRQPTDEELAICLPFVEKHIALVNPTRLVLVGGTATKAILKDTRGITRLRGQLFEYTNTYMQRAIPVHVIYHPSYLLRQPLAKKQCWADLLALKMALQPV